MQQTLGPIQSGVVYPLDVFCRLAGFGRCAMRSARRDGLRVIRTGQRAFVRGDDFHAWLAQQAESSVSASAK